MIFAAQDHVLVIHNMQNLTLQLKPFVSARLMARFQATVKFK